MHDIEEIKRKITQKKIEINVLLKEKRQFELSKRKSNKPTVKYTLRLTPELLKKLQQKAQFKKMALSKFLRGVLDGL